MSELNAPLIRNHLRKILSRIPKKGRRVMSEFTRRDIDEVMEAIDDIAVVIAP